MRRGMHFVIFLLHAGAANAVTDGAASAVTDGAAVGPARVVISTGDAGVHGAFMYAPVIETLRAGFLHVTPHVAVRSSGASAPWARAQQQLKRGDVYVHVGPWGHETVP